MGIKSVFLPNGTHFEYDDTKGPFRLYDPAAGSGAAFENKVLVGDSSGNLAPGDVTGSSLDLSSPPPIGDTTPNSGTFSDLEIYDASASPYLYFRSGGSYDGIINSDGRIYLQAQSNNGIFVQSGGQTLARMDYSGGTTKRIFPNTDGDVALGLSIRRWSDVYGVAGDFSGDVVIGGELQGSRFNFCATLASNTAITAGSSVYLYINNLQMSSNIGWVAQRAGSVVGLGTIHNTTVAGGTLEIDVMKNGVDQTTLIHSLNVTVGSYQVDVDTIARDSVTFSAGDVISLRVHNTGASTTNIDTLVTTVDCYYDA